MGWTYSPARSSGRRYWLPGIAAAGAAIAILTGGCGSSAHVTGTVVTAVETEYRIVLSQTRFTPGTYTFDVENHGQLTHSLEITGPGIKRQVSRTLSPGQSTYLTVRLRVGTYDVLCPIDHHAARGMFVIIHVT